MTLRRQRATAARFAPFSQLRQAGKKPTTAQPAHKVRLISELKALRHRLGWSMAGVSDRLGVDQQTLSEWEQGISLPPLDTIEAWAAALGMAVTLSPVQVEERAGLQIDWAERRVTVDGAPIRLAPMEWKLIERLAAAPGELVTHQALWRHLYGDNQPDQATSTAMRVLISRLRRVLPVRIKTQWGRGYAITGIAPPADSTACDQCTGGVQRQPAAEALGLPWRPSKHEVCPAPDVKRREASTSTAQPFAVPGQRVEELSAIERFLAERGATRCPDVAALQQSPLPALIWDKTTRKWNRPSPSTGAPLLS